MRGRTRNEFRGGVSFVLIIYIQKLIKFIMKYVKGLILIYNIE